ncbi:Ribosomal large subunit pseudouridine synthase A [Klebsiella pneumoniae]|nr:Ribosomal large subunit pseudouridine synthase A [Klebsiella pneumoniae]CAH6307970.1 Ribosomal large subunit pseudouridine synthase A [Klebsiella pneumoniae]
MAMENYNPPQDPWLVILYQDEHIMVVNKPSGLLSVPGRLEEHKDSVMTRIQRDFPQAESVHRLDMATSGVIVVALNKAAERELKRQFREREPKKQYVARVWGHPQPAEGLVDLPLICDWPNRPMQKVCYETGKAAQTEYEVLEYAEDNTARVRLKPITGRSHQLRVHMASDPWRPLLCHAGGAGDGPAPAAARRDAHHHPSCLRQRDDLSRADRLLTLILRVACGLAACNSD